MTTWTPPADLSLSITDVQHIVDGLTQPDTRTAALDFTDTIVNDALVYVICCELAYRRHEPRPAVDVEGGYWAYLRDCTEATR
ncbi:MAG TPA: hypothetical protein VI172_08200 [Candidatus Dormibacteraeota bacterium]|jgi:hypothetical protein